MTRAAYLGILLTLALSASGLSQTARAPDPQRKKALAYEQEGKIPEAEAAWRAVLKAHPSSPEPYAHLGLLEARQGHYKEAVPLYRKALANGPEVPGLRLNLGLALFKSGEMKEAIQEFSLLNGLLHLTALEESTSPVEPQAGHLGPFSSAVQWRGTGLSCP